MVRQRHQRIGFRVVRGQTTGGQRVGHQAEIFGGAFAIVPFLKKLCGDQYTAMKDALRDPDTGRVSIDKVSEFIAQLLEQVAPNS